MTRAEGRGGSLAALLAVVGDVLATTPSPNDTFVRLGGTSLAAVRIVARLEHVHGLRLAPGDLLSDVRLREVAAVATGVDVDTEGSAAPPLPGPRPVAAAQAWWLESESRETAATSFDFAVALRVDAQIDPVAFGQAVADVHAHHPALRLRFGTRDGVHTMTCDAIAPAYAVEACAHADLDAAVATFAARGFDPAAGPRWRVLLLRHEDATTSVLLGFDHRAVDGWSLGVVLEDLALASAARAEGGVPRLAPAGSWLDHAERERTVLPGAVDRAVAHWRTRLPATFEEYPLALPGRLSGARLRVPAHVERSVPSEAASALARGSSPAQTPFVRATAALARALADLTDRRSVRILTSSANRRHPGHERTVGWFATGVFPTYDLDPGGSWEADLAQVAAEVRAAMDVGDVPAVAVRRALWPDSPAGFRTDTGVYLACDDSGDDEVVMAGHRASPIPVPDRADSPGIHLFARRGAAGWSITAHFHADEYPPSVVDDLLDRLIDQLVDLSRHAASTTNGARP